VRLRFEDSLLERFYVSGVPPEGVELAVQEYCLDALAVLVAARSVADFRALDAFRPIELRGRPLGRLALPLGAGWALIFSVEAEDTDDATASIKALVRAPAAARRSSR
jgi:plasmid maintenance system killer protein